MDAIKTIEDAVKLLRQTIYSPSLPQKPPLEDLETTELRDLYNNLIEFRTFIKKLGEGDLSARLSQKGYLAGILKAQQANLRHMTWQAQRIAEGDFEQHLDFLGDFSIAFNMMTLQLKESMQTIKIKEAELKKANLGLQRQIQEYKKTQKLLAEKEALYRKLTETIQDVIWTIDADTLKTSFISSSIFSLSGYTSEEVLTMPMSKLVTEKTAKKIAATISKYKKIYNQDDNPKKDCHCTFETTFLRKDASTIWTEIIINFIWDKKTKNMFINAVIRDISKRRKKQEELKYKATIDNLTQIANRYYFLTTAEKKIDESKMSEIPLCFLMLDIDHFKKINDTFGHITGDMFLRTVSSLCQNTLRATDMIGRIGGEEFAIFMQNTILKDGINVAERIRTTIANKMFETYSKEIIPLTISIGITQMTSEDSITTLMARADEALYLAKKKGRNKVCSL